MSDAIAICDNCGAHGGRAENAAAPDFWFYIESTDRTPGSRGLYVVWACSEECRASLWKLGPGRGLIDEVATQRARRSFSDQVEQPRQFVPIDDLGCYCGELPAIDRPCGCCAKWLTMSPQSMKEWLDSWGTGPNWVDPKGAMIAISKDSVRALISAMERARKERDGAADDADKFTLDREAHHLAVRKHRDALLKVAMFARHADTCAVMNIVYPRGAFCDCGFDAARKECP